LSSLSAMSTLRQRAILFDLDGTVADTAADLTRALNRVLHDRKQPPIAVSKAAPYASRGARGMLEVGFDLTPEHPEFAELQASLLNYYAADICVDSAPYAGMRECIAALCSRNIAWGIVTNKATKYTQLLWQQMQRDHDFLSSVHCIVCGDTTPHRKPHPASLLHAAQLLNLEPHRIIYVGDDARDIQAAKAAGMASVAAGYGYVANGSDINTWGADAVVANTQALNETLLRMLASMG
jgi:N-acetyl-D-muramate 6-phosphate phosphatase